MDDNVVVLDMVTRLDLPVERILTGAQKADLESVVVLGYDQDGDFFFAATKADGGDVLWLLEDAKRRLFASADRYREGA